MRASVAIIGKYVDYIWTYWKYVDVYSSYYSRESNNHPGIIPIWDPYGAHLGLNMGPNRVNPYGTHIFLHPRSMRGPYRTTHMGFNWVQGGATHMGFNWVTCGPTHMGYNWVQGRPTHMVFIWVKCGPSHKGFIWIKCGTIHMEFVWVKCGSIHMGFILVKYGPTTFDLSTPLKQR